MSGSKTHFIMLASYDSWANQRLFDAIAALDGDIFHQVAHTLSLSRIFTEMMAFDRLWLHRFTGQGEAARGEGELPTLHAARIARTAEDARILAWLEDLPPEKLAGRFSYMNLADMRTISERLAPALSHVFNRHTHYRGMASALLSGFGAAPDMEMTSFYKSDLGRHYK